MTSDTRGRLSRRTTPWISAPRLADYVIDIVGFIGDHPAIDQEELAEQLYMMAQLYWHIDPALSDILRVEKVE